MHQRLTFYLNTQLHPIMAQKSMVDFFARGLWILPSLRHSNRLKSLSAKLESYAEKDRGTDLMRRAFHVDSGNLTDQNQHTAEKQARSDLFAGAIGSCKNPGSHRDVDLTAEEAAEMIIFASHLLRIVDSCKQPEDN